MSQSTLNHRLSPLLPLESWRVFFLPLVALRATNVDDSALFGFFFFAILEDERVTLIDDPTPPLDDVAAGALFGASMSVITSLFALVDRSRFLGGTRFSLACTDDSSPCNFLFFEAL